MMDIPQLILEAFYIVIKSVISLSGRHTAFLCAGTFCRLQFHRIIERPVLERTTVVI